MLMCYADLGWMERVGEIRLVSIETGEGVQAKLYEHVQLGGLYAALDLDGSDDLFEVTTPEEKRFLAAEVVVKSESIWPGCHAAFVKQWNKALLG